MANTGDVRQSAAHQQAQRGQPGLLAQPDLRGRLEQLVQAEPREPLNSDEREFWLAFVRALIVVPRLLDADLMVGQQLSMTEYSVLMHLSEAPDRRLRMTDLAGRCAVSLSGMTRIVARLIADGYVRRVRSGEDARGAFAVLTDAGFARLEAAYPEHLASVRRHVIDHLDGFDLRVLAEAIGSFGSVANCEAVVEAAQLAEDCPPASLTPEDACG